MPNDDLQRQSGKTRALRIRMDYFRQRGMLYWSRWILACVGFAGATLYGLFVLFGVWANIHSGRQQPAAWTAVAVAQVNTGALSTSHAHFEDDCYQCHSPTIGESIANDAWKLNTDATLLHLSRACQKCHSVDAHLNVVTGESAAIDLNCVGCHSEHRGRDFDIARVRSPSCTQCHADLAANCPQAVLATPDLNPRVSAFTEASHSLPAEDGGPGQFRSLQTDTGRIKFDHRQHLNPGQVEEGSRGAFRKDMLSGEWQNSYQSDPTTGLVTLQCSDCHQLQSNGRSLSTSTQIERSHFYAPIQFDQHCVACHQMTYSGQTAETLPLPHAAPRGEVRQLLAAKLVSGRLTGQIKTVGDQTQTNTTQTNATSPVWEPLQLEEVDLTLAVDRVFTRCQQCHAEANDIKEETIIARRTSGATDPLIPQTWLQFGLFDHGSHEKITHCQFCHEMNSNPSSLGNDHEVVMIKGPESCTPCHRDPSDRPAIELSSKEQQLALLGMANQPDLASDDCTTCHRYHWHRDLTKLETSLSSRMGNKRVEP